jgi:hypothetical protein
MTFRAQTSPRRSAKTQTKKNTRTKKAKEKKQRATAKQQIQQETVQASPQEIVEKTLTRLEKLGNQIFALSPFSQYYDDWLINLKRTLVDFESDPAINTDEQYVGEQNQIMQTIQATLAEKRLQESTLTEEAKALAETNHKIVEADKQYAEQTRALSNKRNTDVQRLTTKIRQLEEELTAQQNVKIGFFQFKEKRLAQEKLARTTKALKDAKNELEVTLQNFTVEQDKLHDNYQKTKQQLSEKSERLHKELEKLETDTSKDIRQEACTALANNIKALMQRLQAES